MQALYENVAGIFHDARRDAALNYNDRRRPRRIRHAPIECLVEIYS